MAARKTKFLSDEHRLKIQTSQLINRLTSFVNGEVKMEPAQVTAALGLLKKALPDLASVALTGEDGGAIKHEHEVIGLSRTAELLGKFASRPVEGPLPQSSED
jgi:hypothetical protein